MSGVSFEAMVEGVAKAFAEAGELEALRRREMLTTEEAARLYGVSVKTLKEWRKLGRGPRWRALGRKIIYPQQELRRYFHEDLVRTSDAA